MKNAKRVLIISFRSGFGHIRGGEALLDYAKEQLPQLKVEHHDMAEIDQILSWHADSYEYSVKKAPWLWKLIYQQSVFFRVLKLEAYALGFLRPKIKRFLIEKKPDAIIFTNLIMYPLFASALKSLKKQPVIGAVVTDYHAHQFYCIPRVNRYFVPHQKVGEGFVAMGMAPEKMVVTGIPINPRFYIPQRAPALKKKYGIAGKGPVVLLVASFKASEKEFCTLVGDLLKSPLQISLIVICNNNHTWKMLLEKHFAGEDRLHAVHWTNVMEEYIKMADVVITKAGGLTVSECLALEKQMIIIRPIPGQEEHNTAFVVENGFGMQAKNMHEVVELLPRALNKKNTLVEGVAPSDNPSKLIFREMMAAMEMETKQKEPS